MSREITSDIIKSFKERLEQHPVYEAVATIEDLQCFMQHHVYSVWDFMSLIKYLQSIIAPTEYPWTPRGDADVRRFINELVLEGKRLIPFWRGKSDTLGVNLKQVFYEPRPLDLVLWVNGAAALPYLEEGELSQPEVWARFNRIFRGEFIGFAIWIN